MKRGSLPLLMISAMGAMEYEDDLRTIELSVLNTIMQSRPSQNNANKEVVSQIVHAKNILSKFKKNNEDIDLSTTIDLTELEKKDDIGSIFLLNNPCKFCKKNFVDLKYHYHCHHRNDDNKCYQCPHSTFSSVEEYTAHYKAKHTIDKYFKAVHHYQLLCPTCHHRSQDRMAYNRHIRLVEIKRKQSADRYLKKKEKLALKKNI